jgi:histidine triad (HIT) family protein
MNNCLFCKIVNNQIPCHKVYDDENVLAFLDIDPLAKGHIVVIPKKHAENILDLDDENLVNLFLAIKKITQHLKNKLNPDGFNIGINMRKYAGQAVEHLHAHILPRFKGDGGGSIHSIVHCPPKEKLENILLQVAFVD